MADAMQVVQTMCDRYQKVVCANDSAAYGGLFCEDAICVPPGSEPQRGRDAIARGEQENFDTATWSLALTPLDALMIDDEWGYAIVGGICDGVSRKDGSTERKEVTINWLLKRAPGGAWLVARELWNER